MRRTLLSCTSLARHGGAGVAATLLATALTAPPTRCETAGGRRPACWISPARNGLRSALAAGVLGFSVLSAIVLLRTRARAAATDEQLRGQI